jgi:hypothetical protein
MKQPSSHLLFMGDIKGTKSALQTANYDELLTRIDTLYSEFASCFAKCAKRSKSLHGLTLSDSVIAWWTDPVEGKRFAGDFMWDLYDSLSSFDIQFRGFLDHGPVLESESVMSFVTNKVNRRFSQTLPVGVALWSVATAEASHFPNGLFVAANIVEDLNVGAEPELYGLPPFRYRRLRREISTPP